MGTLGASGFPAEVLRPRSCNDNNKETLKKVFLELQTSRYIYKVLRYLSSRQPCLCCEICHFRLQCIFPYVQAVEFFVCLLLQIRSVK